MKKSRRGVLKWATASGLTVLAGCNTSDDDGGSDGQTGEEISGGHLRIGFNNTPFTFNPIMHLTGTEYTTSGWVYSNLTILDANGELVPDLATDWEPNDPENPTAWTFSMRDDATFNNSGKTVQAEDVKATFDKLYNPETGSPHRGTIGPIDSIDVVDDFTVRFNTWMPYADMPRKMAKVQSRIIQKEAIESDFDGISNQPAGSGPFTVAEYSVSDTVVYEAVDDYYKADEDGNQLPYLDKITLSALPEAGPRVTAFEGKEIDVMNRLPATQWERADNISGSEAVQLEGGWVYPIVMDTTTEPFDDNRVRQAVKFAVDKEGMLDRAQDGKGSLLQHVPLAPSYNYYADLPHKFGTTPQLDEANSLMDEAGYGDGITLDYPLYVLVGIAAPIEPQALVFQENLSEIGIEFEIQTVTIDQFSDISFQEPFYTQFLGRRAVEDGILFMLLHSDGPWNADTNFNHAEFDQELEAAMAEMDEEQKRQHYRRCQEIVQDEGGYVVPFVQDRLGAKWNYVGDYEFESTGIRSYMEKAKLTSNAPNP